MHYKYKKILGNTIIYLLLLIVFIFTVFPLFYTFMGSFKSNMELLANSGRLIPEKFITDNYVQAWKLANFKQYTFNSIFLSFFVVVGTIFTSTIAGYVFERGNFRLKNFLFAMVVYCRCKSHQKRSYCRYDN